jgi:hypothetical protein
MCSQVMLRAPGLILADQARAYYSSEPPRHLPARRFFFGGRAANFLLPLNARKSCLPLHGTT